MLTRPEIIESLDQLHYELLRMSVKFTYDGKKKEKQKNSVYIMHEEE